MNVAEWPAARIRQTFLDFFREKGHQIVPSAPIVVKNDPTLMFTNAGMNPFKEYFLGDAKPKYKRVADTQKCLRVSGKHNDLEEVGKDGYHHTMFEMLGNWSFGDYFKKEAIGWAWELLTKVYGIDPDRLYVTVFGGDPDGPDGTPVGYVRTFRTPDEYVRTFREKERIPADTEAEEIWRSILAAPSASGGRKDSTSLGGPVPIISFGGRADAILRFGKKDNFWEMGDTGPCGPCSEIHIDIRSDEERMKTPGHTLVNKGDPKVIELWNLVFIQFNRKADGSLHPLPQKHVDTGMGFERLCMVLQGKEATYDTDVFTPIITEIESLTERANVPEGRDVNSRSTSSETAAPEERDVALRVVADHIRAICFTISDGELPSNAKAGYVVRRILRRAVRYGYSFLDMDEPWIYRLVPSLADQFADVFPELRKQGDFISRVVKEEEANFLRTLSRGMTNLNEHHSTKVEGPLAFELFDTYGFPLDLTQLIAAEKGWTVDIEGFNREMAKQRERSQQAGKVDVSDWNPVVVNAGKGEVVIKGYAPTVTVEAVSQFIGWDYLEAEVKITRYREVQSKGRKQYQLVFNLTPFYAEGGGQNGDTGWLIHSDERITITDTKKEGNVIIHFTDKLPSDVSATFKAVVDKARRVATVKNHSATHLLHAALRKVLGTHVQQKGSYVGPDHLRFDFSHFEKMSDEQIAEVEDIVNEKIKANIPRGEERTVPFEEAKKRGAMALFGEKYGDVVRVITFDPSFSIELCGGTHAASTGEIGLFRITQESAVGAGVRRIKAVTGQAALDFIEEEKQKAKEAEERERKLRQQKEAEKLEASRVAEIREKLKSSVQQVNGFNFIAEIVDVNSNDSLRSLSFDLKKSGKLFMVLGARINDKPALSVAISDDLVKEKQLDAGKIIKELSKEIKGGGGGQPFFATAGGSDVSGLERAIARAKEIVGLR